MFADQALASLRIETREPSGMQKAILDQALASLRIETLANIQKHIHKKDQALASLRIETITIENSVGVSSRSGSREPAD